ncbi:hypothetical protein ABPG72_001342 [Tetrahymena utriculariae]
MKQEDFETIRVQNPVRYKAILKQYIKIYQPQNLQEIAMCIIKKPSEERNEDEINILQQWTSRFKFFEDLNRKQMNVELRLHHKCCSRIKYEKVSKGTAVFQAGNLNFFFFSMPSFCNIPIGDIPEKFYIVLSGSVNVMLPKSKELLAQEVVNERSRIKNLKTLEIKNSIWYRINQIKDRREQLKMSKNLAYSQSLSPHHNINHFKIPSFQRVDSLTSSRQDTLLENSFPSSPRTNNLRLQNSSRFDPALSNQSDEINITASNFSEHMDQTKLNNSQTEDKSIKNLNFTNKILPKDSRLQERHHHKRGSIFNEFRQYRRESFFSDLNFPIKKDESPADIQASIFKRQNSPIIDFKNLTNESEDNSVIESKDGNGQQEEESQIDLFSTLKLEENNILDENDPAYQQLGNIQLEAIQDLDCFFQQGVLKYKYLLTLNAGSMFGELGLLLKKPRAATILAREDTEFAVLNADDFSNILSVGEMKQINRRLQFFAENFLQGCGKEIVTKYSYNFKCVKYNIGNIIYNQGDSSQFVYIIKKGFVELSQTRVIKKKQDQLDKANSISKMLNTFKKQENLQSIEKLVKEKVCLSQISVGQCFGEIEVIKNMTRISHAICISNKVVLWELPATIFQKLITENKFLYQQFLDQIKLKEEWYQKQEISHGLQKEIKAEISESAKDQQQQQAIQEEIKIRKQKLQKKYSLKCNSFIKGQDEEIEKHIKLELLKEEMEKDMKFLQDLKQMGGYDFLKNQELVKSVEIIGIKKQLNLNQIHKLQRQDEQFDQKVFKVMQKIEYQKKQMKELIRKIMVKNSYKYMPKFKLNEFIGMDIKHALNLQIFSAFQNQTKTEPQKSFETQEEKVDKKLLLDSQQESLNKNLLDKQVDQQDIIAESQENNYDKQFTQPNWIDGYQINNDKNLIVQQEQSQKMEIKKKNQNLKQNFKNKLELAQLDSKKNELFQKFKPQVPLSIKNQSPFSSRDSQSLLFQQQNTSNLFGISGIQKYFQTCKTAREKIMIAQKQQQKTSLIKDQQNNTNCLQIQQIHSNSTRSQQPQINSSQEKSQRFSLNIAELNSNDLEQTRSKQNSQRESVLFYNNYSFIQQNIHNKQMDNHSSIFTVKPFFYTKNQQNLEIQKALPQQDRFREKNMKNMKAHLNKLKTDNQQKLIKHQKSITANINKGEYFFKTNEEIVNVYNVNTSRKDFKRETFQSTQETFRKQYEYEQQKSFQTQNHYVKDISKIQEKENITDKISDDQKQDNYQIINTANEDTFKSFLSINTYSNRQSNIEPNQAVYFHQKNMFVESQHHNLIRSQSNPNITQNCMQFNRKNSNLGINQQPFLSNSQQVKVKASPQIEQPHSTREARFRWPLNSQKHSADCLIAANQINSHQKNQQQNEKYFSQAPISPILLQNDSYQEKNFYMYNLDLGIDIKPKSSLLSKTEQSIENQSLKEQDDKNFNLQSSFCYSIESYNQPLIQKHISLSNSPKKQNFVEMNRKITKPINKQNNYTIKKKTNINPICFQEYNDNEEQDQKYNQEKILKQLIKCRAKQKPKNQSIKETKEDKLIRIKKSLLNYCESSNDLSNSQTLKGKVEVQSQPQKSNNKQLLLKRQNLVKDQNDQMYCQTASSFYPNFDEIQNQLSFNTVNQYANSPSNQERSPPVYNQNSFTSTKHNMFRQKPQKLFLLHNSTNYPLQIYKIESILRTYKNENIK